MVEAKLGYPLVYTSAEMFIRDPCLDSVKRFLHKSVCVCVCMRL